MDRESIEFDVVVVGAGPAGLACACRLGQLAAERGTSISVCVLEKGAEIGAHIVSGALVDPRALDELFPSWRDEGAPLGPAVARDTLAWLGGETRAVDVPRWLVPRSLSSRGAHVASLGRLCGWLGERAEGLGCDVIPATAVTGALYGDDGSVVGVRTGDRGIARDGTPKPNAEPGLDVRAQHVVVAEGCRGSLGAELERRFELRSAADPQHYGLGLKELWSVDAARHRPGDVLHTVGWPLPRDVDGGGFVYHADGGLVSVGLIVSLAYSNPCLSPFEEFQRFKQHARIRPLLEGGTRVGFGARAVNRGGWPSLPRLTMPGALRIGCEPGFLNPARLKGTHTAMKTGMLAAETVFEALQTGAAAGRELERYAERVRDSWVGAELRRDRNFSAGVQRFGRVGGGALAFVEQNLLRGAMPWTLHDRVSDRERLVPRRAARVIEYARPDGVVAFDRLSSVHLSNTHHDEDQPSHLELADPDLPVTSTLRVYDEPAQRYCPAGVFEVVTGEAGPRFVVNAANCLHCKACDIKDPYGGNIRWRPPEGGGGPAYAGM